MLAWILVSGAIISTLLMIGMPIAFVAGNSETYTYKRPLQALVLWFVFLLCSILPQFGIDALNPTFESATWYQFFVYYGVRVCGLVGILMVALCFWKARAAAKARRESTT